eukprot:COSAG05_NODE_104_length_18950_cov_118.655403_14_plen_62_part_00
MEYVTDMCSTGVEFVPGNRSGALCTCVIPNRRRVVQYMEGLTQSCDNPMAPLQCPHDHVRS